MTKKELDACCETADAIVSHDRNWFERVWYELKNVKDKGLWVDKLAGPAGKRSRAIWMLEDRVKVLVDKLERLQRQVDGIKNPESAVNYDTN